ncbi:Endo-1,4-beta-xylanase, putative, xyn5A [Entophlyctis sp. JEL0112]|nr:Endo-1,4-beta-xylanase, putative, xyn5A [Entophlyctis sp. JEL0112]
MIFKTIAALGALASQALAALTVTTTTQYQSVTGIGGMLGWNDYPAASVDVLYGTGSGQLGMNILRCRVSENGESDWATEAASIKEAYRVNPNLIVFCSVWTAPASMTTTLSAAPAGCNYKTILSTSSWSAYADYLNSFITYMKANGAPLHAISIQNEPDWTWMCWQSSSMRDWLAQYGSKITGALVMAPESLDMSASYLNTIFANAEATANFNIVGGHLYGSTPYSFDSKGKEVWMTEKYWDAGWSNTLGMSNEMHETFNVGWNAYVHWWTCGYLIGDGSPGYSCNNNVVTPRGWVYSLWTKNVAAGYKRVATSGTIGTASTAFAGNGKIVVMVTNNAAASSATITVPSFSSVTVSAVSSAQQSVFTVPTTSSGNSVTFTLPDSSVVAVVFTTSGSSGGNPTTTTAGAVKTTTAAKTTAAATTAAGGATCSAKYGQCGGSGWTGPTCCTASTCTFSNAYYSQCL